MGYSICLSRMNMETYEDTNPITLVEWLEVIEKDKELTHIKSLEGINPITKQKILIEVPGQAIWTHKDKDYDIEFYYRDGKVCVDDHNENLIMKMKQLARKLDAKVLDDFDEEI